MCSFSATFSSSQVLRANLSIHGTCLLHCCLMKMCHHVLERSYNVRGQKKTHHVMSHTFSMPIYTQHTFSIARLFTPLSLSLFCTSFHLPSSLPSSLHITILSSPVMSYVSNHLVCLHSSSTEDGAGVDISCHTTKCHQNGPTYWYARSCLDELSLSLIRVSITSWNT